VKEARAQAQAGFALNPTFTISRFRNGAESDNPIFLKQRRNIYEGLRKAGIRKNDRSSTSSCAASRIGPQRNPRFNCTYVGADRPRTRSYHLTPVRRENRSEHRA
jgi:hypothetical protein